MVWEPGHNQKPRGSYGERRNKTRNHRPVFSQLLLPAFSSTFLFPRVLGTPFPQPTYHIPCIFLEVHVYLLSLNETVCLWAVGIRKRPPEIRILRTYRIICVCHLYVSHDVECNTPVKQCLKNRKTILMNLPSQGPSFSLSKYPYPKFYHSPTFL